ncbi:MAG TPA: hypothetical protein DCL49_11670, partial [Candidatus Omnitrophica bacterium]|nr:hypothetical protein [Candidatus Omnitrophota bacterium]
ARGKQAFLDYEKDTFSGKLNNLIQTAANADSLSECKELIATTVALLDKNIKDINKVLNLLRTRIKKDGFTSSPVNEAKKAIGEVSSSVTAGPTLNLLTYLAVNPYLINMIARYKRVMPYLNTTPSEFEGFINADHIYYKELEIELREGKKIKIPVYRIKHDLTLGPGGGGVRYVYPRDLIPFSRYFRVNQDSSDEVEIIGVNSYQAADRFIKRWVFEEDLALAMGMTLKNAGVDLKLGGVKGGPFLGEIEERNGRYFLIPVTAEDDAINLERITGAISEDWAINGIVNHNNDKPAGDVHATFKPFIPKVRIVEWFINRHLRALLTMGKIAELDKELGRELSPRLQKIYDDEKNDKESRYFLDFQYAREAWKYYLDTGKPVPELGTYTSKSPEVGGSFVRDISTALGTIMMIEEIVKRIFPERAHLERPLEGMTAAIQGCGNAGGTAAKLLYGLGVKILAISDSRGAIYDAKGLNIDEVLAVKEKTVSLINYAKAEILKNADDLLELKVDILIPAAREDVITKENAGRIKAKIIAESANGPSTLEADAILYKKGIIVIYDVLANAGGVIVSYFERIQNITGKVWSAEYIKDKLKNQLTKTLNAVWEIADKERVDLRTAGDIYSIRHIIEIKRNGLSQKEIILSLLPPSTQKLDFLNIRTNYQGLEGAKRSKEGSSPLKYHGIAEPEKERDNLIHSIINIFREGEKLKDGTKVTLTREEVEAAILVDKTYDAYRMYRKLPEVIAAKGELFKDCPFEKKPLLIAFVGQGVVDDVKLIFDKSSEQGLALESSRLSNSMEIKNAIWEIPYHGKKTTFLIQDKDNWLAVAVLYGPEDIYRLGLLMGKGGDRISRLGDKAKGPNTINDRENIFEKYSKAMVAAKLLGFSIIDGPDMVGDLNVDKLMGIMVKAVWETVDDINSFWLRGWLSNLARKAAFALLHALNKLQIRRKDLSAYRRKFGILDSVYKSINKKEVLKPTTSNPEEEGGFSHTKRMVTSRGVVQGTISALRYLSHVLNKPDGYSRVAVNFTKKLKTDFKIDFQNMSCIIQGFGDVGSGIAKLLLTVFEKAGINIRGFSNRYFAVYREDGLPKELVLEARDIAEDLPDTLTFEKFLGLHNFDGRLKGAKLWIAPPQEKDKAAFSDNDRLLISAQLHALGIEDVIFGSDRSIVNELIYQEVTVLFPSAAANVIQNEEQIGKLKCPIIAEGANNAIKEDLQPALKKRGIIYIPGELLNGGGIFTSKEDIRRNHVDGLEAILAHPDYYHTTVVDKIDSLVLQRTIAFFSHWFSSDDNFAKDLVEHIRIAAQQIFYKADDMIRNEDRYLMKLVAIDQEMTHGRLPYRHSLYEIAMRLAPIGIIYNTEDIPGHLERIKELCRTIDTIKEDMKISNFEIMELRLILFELMKMSRHLEDRQKQELIGILFKILNNSAVDTLVRKEALVCLSYVLKWNIEIDAQQPINKAVKLCKEIWANPNEPYRMHAWAEYALYRIKGIGYLEGIREGKNRNKDLEAVSSAVEREATGLDKEPLLFLAYYNILVFYQKLIPAFNQKIEASIEALRSGNTTPEEYIKRIIKPVKILEDTHKVLAWYSRLGLENEITKEWFVPALQWMRFGLTTYFADISLLEKEEAGKKARSYPLVSSLEAVSLTQNHHKAWMLDFKAIKEATENKVGSPVEENEPVPFFTLKEAIESDFNTTIDPNLKKVTVKKIYRLVSRVEKEEIDMQSFLVDRENPLKELLWGAINVITRLTVHGQKYFIDNGNVINEDRYRGAMVWWLRRLLNNRNFSLVVKASEGPKKGHSLIIRPTLVHGEHLGFGEATYVDIALNILEMAGGITNRIKQGPVTSLLLSPAKEGEESIPHLPDDYMFKIVLNKYFADIDVDAIMEESLNRNYGRLNVRLMVKLLADEFRKRGKEPKDIRVMSLYRDRHEDLFEAFKANGFTVVIKDFKKLGGYVSKSSGRYADGNIIWRENDDWSDGLALALGDIDLIIGAGGMSEASNSAAIARKLGGKLRGIAIASEYMPHGETLQHFEHIWNFSPGEMRRHKRFGLDPRQIFTENTLSKGNPDESVLVIGIIRDYPWLAGKIDGVRINPDIGKAAVNVIWMGGIDNIYNLEIEVEISIAQHLTQLSKAKTEVEKVNALYELSLAYVEFGLWKKAKASIADALHLCKRHTLEELWMITIAGEYIKGLEQFGIGEPVNATNEAIKTFTNALEIIKRHNLKDALQVQRMLRRIYMYLMEQKIKEAEENMRFSAREKREKAAALFDEALELWKKAFSYTGHEVDLLERWNSLHLWQVRQAYQERIRILWEKGTKDSDITTRIRIAYEAFNEFRDERLVKEHEGRQKKYNGDILLCVLLDTAFAESPPARRKALIEAWLDFKERVNEPIVTTEQLYDSYKDYGLTMEMAKSIIHYRNSKDMGRIETIGELLALPLMRNNNVSGDIIKFLLNIIPTDEMLEKREDKLYLLQKKELLPTTATQEELLWVRLMAMLKAAKEETLVTPEFAYDYSEAQRLAGYIEGVYRYNALFLLSVGHPQGAKGQYKEAIQFYAKMCKEFGGYYPFRYQLQIIDVYKEMGRRFKSAVFYQHALDALKGLFDKETREKIFKDPDNIKNLAEYNKEFLERIKTGIGRLIDALPQANNAGNLLEQVSSPVNSSLFPAHSSTLKKAMDSLPDYAKNLAAKILEKFMEIASDIYRQFYEDKEHGVTHGIDIVKEALEIAKKEYSHAEIGPDFYVIIASGLLHDADTQSRATHHIDSAKLAVRILREMGWYKWRIAQVVDAIYAHRGISAYEGLKRINPKTIEAKIIHDANTLSAVENFERIAEYGRGKREFYNQQLDIKKRLTYLKGCVKEGFNEVDSISYVTHHLIHSTTPDTYYTHTVKDRAVGGGLFLKAKNELKRLLETKDISVREDVWSMLKQLTFVYHSENMQKVEAEEWLDDEIVWVSYYDISNVLCEGGMIVSSPIERFAICSNLLQLREMLIQRGWNLSKNESFIKELVIFHNPSFYHQDFSVAENGYEYDKKKVLLYSQESALLVCRPNDAKVTELITTGCINCVGVSLISPLADGLAVFYLSHFFNKEYGYERDLEDAKKSDDIEKTLNEIKSVFTRLGAKDEDVRALIVGGYTYCGGLYATKASDFFKEQKIRFDARYADSLNCKEKGIRIDVKAMKAVALVSGLAGLSLLSDYFDKSAGVSSPLDEIIPGDEYLNMLKVVLEQNQIAHSLPVKSSKIKAISLVQVWELIHTHSNFVGIKLKLGIKTLKGLLAYLMIERKSSLYKQVELILVKNVLAELYPIVNELGLLMNSAPFDSERINKKAEDALTSRFFKIVYDEDANIDNFDIFKRVKAGNTQDGFVGRFVNGMAVVKNGNELLPEYGQLQSNTEEKQRRLSLMRKGLTTCKTALKELSAAVAQKETRMVLWKNLRAEEKIGLECLSEEYFMPAEDDEYAVLFEGKIAVGILLWKRRKEKNSINLRGLFISHAKRTRGYATYLWRSAKLLDSFIKGKPGEIKAIISDILPAQNFWKDVLRCESQCKKREFKIKVIREGSGKELSLPSALRDNDILISVILRVSSSLSGEVAVLDVGKKKMVKLPVVNAARLDNQQKLSAVRNKDTSEKLSNADYKIIVPEILKGLSVQLKDWWGNPVPLYIAGSQGRYMLFKINAGLVYSEELDIVLEEHFDSKYIRGEIHAFLRRNGFIGKIDFISMKGFKRVKDTSFSIQRILVKFYKGEPSLAVFDEQDYQDLVSGTLRYLGRDMDWRPAGRGLELIQYFSLLPDERTQYLLDNSLASRTSHYQEIIESVKALRAKAPKPSTGNDVLAVNSSSIDRGVLSIEREKLEGAIIQGYTRLSGLPREKARESIRKLCNIINENREKESVIRQIELFESPLYQVFQIQEPFGVNVYALIYRNKNGKTRAILVDAGPGFYFEKLKAQLKEKLGVALNDIESVIITHGHPDHIGALGYFLRENPSIKVVAHPQWPKVVANIFPNDTTNKEYYDTLTRYYHLIMENAYLENIRAVPFDFRQEQDYMIGDMVFRKMMDIPIFDSSLIILTSP